MPQLTPQQLNQLDTNIKGMLANGATQSDVEQYASDFRSKYDVEKKSEVQTSSQELKTPSNQTSPLVGDLSEKQNIGSEQDPFANVQPIKIDASKVKGVELPPKNLNQGQIDIKNLPIEQLPENIVKSVDFAKKGVDAYKAVGSGDDVVGNNDKKFFELSLEQYPQNIVAVRGLGDIAAKQGNSNEALKYYSDALGISNSADDLTKVAIQQNNIANEKKSSETNKFGITQNELDADVMRNHALENINIALQSNPNNSQAWELKAAIYKANGDDKLASDFLYTAQIVKNASTEKVDLFKTNEDGSISEKSVGELIQDNHAQKVAKLGEGLAGAIDPVFMAYSVGAGVEEGAKEMIEGGKLYINSAKQLVTGNPKEAAHDFALGFVTYAGGAIKGGMGAAMALNPVAGYTFMSAMGLADEVTNGNAQKIVFGALENFTPKTDSPIWEKSKFALDQAIGLALFGVLLHGSPKEIADAKAAKDNLLNGKSLTVEQTKLLTDNIQKTFSSEESLAQLQKALSKIPKDQARAGELASLVATKESLKGEIEKLQTQKAGLDPMFHENIDKRIEGLQKRIDATDKLAHEIVAPKNIEGTELKISADENISNVVGRDAEYKGKVGVIEKDDEGNFIFNDGKTQQILPIENKVEPTETIGELGINIAPERIQKITPESIVKQGDVTFRNRKYFVSFTTDPNDVVGTKVYEYTKDGELLSVGKEGKRNEIIQQFTDEQGISTKQVPFEFPNKKAEAKTEESIEPETTPEPKSEPQLPIESESKVEPSSSPISENVVGVKQFAKGEGGTKGIFVDDSGQLYKSVHNTELKQDENGNFKRVGSEHKTDEYNILNELQDNPNVVKIGEKVNTSEGEAFKIEKLTDAGEISYDEYRQIEKAVEDINKQGIEIGDKISVMRNADGKLVINDFSTASKRKNANDDGLLFDVKEKLSKQDQERVSIENSAELNRQKANDFLKPRETHDYLLTQRPPSIGTHPSGAKITETKIGGRTVWKLSYDKPLTQKEIKSFELTPILDAKENIGTLLKGAGGKLFTISDINQETGEVTLETRKDGEKSTKTLSGREFNNKINDGDYERITPKAKSENVVSGDNTQQPQPKGDVSIKGDVGSEGNGGWKEETDVNGIKRGRLDLGEKNGFYEYKVKNGNVTARKFGAYSDISNGYPIDWVKDFKSVDEAKRFISEENVSKQGESVSETPTIVSKDSENVSSQREKTDKKGVTTDIPYSDFTLHDENGIEFTKRIKNDEGGVNGVAPLNQFKLNQGHDKYREPYPKVHIILDDAEAMKYQESFMSGGKKVYKNHEFRNKINDIAKKYRDKKDEVVLDFRKSEIENKKLADNPPPKTQQQNPTPIKPSPPNKGESETGGITEKAKKLADKIRSLKSKPLELRDENGNLLTIEQKGIDFNPIIEAIATGVEKGGELLDVIKAELEKAKWYQNLTDKGKEAVSKQFEERFNERTTGITHAQTDEAARSLGLPEYEKNPETFAEWDAEAQKRIDNGEMQEVIKKLEDGEMPSAVEQRMMAKYAGDLMAKIEKDPSDANINKYGEFKKLSDVVGGREVAKSLVARQNQVPIMDNVADMYLAAKEANSVDNLTEAQKTEIQQQYDNYKKLKAEAEAKILESHEALAKLQAERELNKEKAKTPRVKKAHGDYVAERKVIKQSISDKLKDIRTNPQLVPVPFARELITISPDVAKLVKSYVAEGVSKLDDVVSKVYDDLKDDIKGITKKDVHDLIAGEYNEKKPTRGQLELQAQDLRNEAKAINKLEKLKAEGTPKTEKGKVARNQRLKELQDEIKKFRKDNPNLEQGLENIKEQNIAKAKKVKEDLAKGNFEKPTRTPFLDNSQLRTKYPKLWKETMDAIAAREDAQHEFELGLIKAEMAKRNAFQKYVIDAGKGVIATGKALRQGIDDSAVFVQNILALTSHPKSAAKALPAHIADFFSEKRYTRWITDLHANHFAWDLIQKSGLDITDPKSLRQQGREEPYSYNLLDKTFKIKGKEINIGKHTIRPFERAFTSLGNHLRADAFLRMAEKYYSQGKTIETHLKEFQDLAKVLNNETGRGKLPTAIENASALVTPIIWSPRLLASTLNTLGFSDVFYGVQGKKGYYASLTPRMRAYAAASFGKYVGVTLSVMGLMALAGWQPDLNPISNTFGSVEKDGKRYNLFGRFAGIVRTAAQMITGKQSQDGLTTKMRIDKRVAMPLHFLRGKLTPAAGTAVDLWTGKTFNNQDVDLQDEMLQNVSPLSITGVADGIKNEGLKSILTTGLPSFIGMNISYEADYQREVPTEINVGTKKVELNETQQKEYQESFNTKKETYVNKLINTPEYKESDDAEKVKLQKTIIDAAEKEAENELRKKYPKQFKETEAERKARLKEKHDLEKLKTKIGIGKSQSPNTGTEGEPVSEGELVGEGEEVNQGQEVVR